MHYKDSGLQNAPNMSFEHVSNHNCVKPIVFLCFWQILSIKSLQTVDLNTCSITKVYNRLVFPFFDVKFLPKSSILCQKHDERRETREDIHVRCKCQIHLPHVNIRCKRLLSNAVGDRSKSKLFVLRA